MMMMMDLQRNPPRNHTNNQCNNELFCPLLLARKHILIKAFGEVNVRCSWSRRNIRLRADPHKHWWLHETFNACLYETHTTPMEAFVFKLNVRYIRVTC